MAFGTGASGAEAPQRALGCEDAMCGVNPHTSWRETEHWEQGRGHFKIDYDREAIEAWNHRP